MLSSFLSYNAICKNMYYDIYFSSLYVIYHELKYHKSAYLVSVKPCIYC